MVVNLIRAQVIITIAVLLASPSFSQADLPKNSSTSDFSLPKTTDGKRDMLILGKQATTTGELISIDGVRITLYPLYKRDSHIELFSPKTSYSRALETATSSERVNIRIFPKPKAPSPDEKERTSYNTIIDGVGFDLECGKQTFRIRSKVTVRIFPSDAKQASQSVTITAKELFHDVVKHLIEFKGDVHVLSKDPEGGDEFKLTSDSLTIFTDKHGDPSTMTATGNVLLTMGADTATSEKAIYRKMPSPPAGEWPNPGKTRVHEMFHRFILSGNPAVVMGPQSMTGANKVIIDRCGDTQQMKTVGGKPQVTLEKTGKMPTLIPPLTAPPAPVAPKVPEKVP